MNEFDLKAAEWDNDPIHWEVSVAVAKKIIETLPIKKEWIVLEYGAGTGNTSFLLKDHFKEIILMDNSKVMVMVMKEKINMVKASNLRVLDFDLEKSDYLCRKFDLIFTQLVLHHVADVESILNKFSKMLNPGGYIAIADLYEEDGSFHGEDFTGHKGFNPGKLSELLSLCSFKNISYTTCFTINKQLTDTLARNYDVFLLSGSQPEN